MLPLLLRTETKNCNCEQWESTSLLDRWWIFKIIEQEKLCHRGCNFKWLHRVDCCVFQKQNIYLRQCRKWLPQDFRDRSKRFQYSYIKWSACVLGNLDNGNGGAAYLYKTDGTFIKELNMVDTKCRPRWGGLTDYCTFAETVAITGTKVVLVIVMRVMDEWLKQVLFTFSQLYHRRIWGEGRSTRRKSQRWLWRCRMCLRFSLCCRSSWCFCSLRITIGWCWFVQQNEDWRLIF